MLISFSVSNFLSFNEETVFSFEGGRVTKKEEHLYRDENLNIEILKFAALYGKNGSGKTNLLMSIDFLKEFVTKGRMRTYAQDAWCRCIKENENKPSCFTIKILVDNQIYTYSLSLFLKTGLIQTEFLILHSGTRKIYLYKKDETEHGYIFDKRLKENRDIEVLSRTLDSTNRPFLYCITKDAAMFFRNNPNAVVLQRIMNWFSQTLEVIFPDQPIQETSLKLDEKQFSLTEFSDLLREFDTGIVAIKKKKVSKEKVFEKLDTRLRQKIEMEIQLAMQFVASPINHLADVFGIPRNFSYNMVVRSRYDIFIINLRSDGTVKYNSLKFVHNINGNLEEFSMAKESDGTHRLFQLLEILVTKKEKVFVMDELSRCLHPNLTVQFVKKYLDYAKNKKLQLLTTTHETKIMNHDIVRRDEIWIADHKKDSSTTLFSLEDKKVRIDKVMDENYIQNVWGGVPVFVEKYAQ